MMTTTTKYDRPLVCELKVLSKLGIDWEEFFERAAIMEFDGNLKRHEAEIRALRELSGIQFKNKFEIERFDQTGEIPDR